jgi:ABC-type polysaccharide/polyol phosphate export permease
VTAAAFDYDSEARRPRALEELLDLMRNRALVRALVSRNLTVRYKRSVFGFLWTMANPAAMLLVLSLAFSRAFSAYAPGYPAFVFPGLLLWNFFAQTTGLVVGEVAAGVDLWRRIRVPKTALAAATLLTGAINLSLALVPLVIIFLLARRPMGAALLTLPVTVLLTALFVFGVSLILATIALYFPDVSDIYAILLPALMFTAPVIYPAAIVPPGLQPLLRWNPMTIFVEAFRAPLYSNLAPSPGAFLLMTLIAAGTLLAGWLLFTRSADDIPYRA